MLIYGEKNIFRIIGFQIRLPLTYSNNTWDGKRIN